MAQSGDRLGVGLTRGEPEFNSVINLALEQLIFSSGLNTCVVNVNAKERAKWIFNGPHLIKGEILR